MPFKKGNTYGGRRSARNSTLIIRTPTPQQVQNEESDIEMQDETTFDDPNDDDIIDADADAEIEELATPRQMDDGDEDEDEDENEQENDDDDGDRPPTIISIPRRRPGRPRGSTTKRSRKDISTPDPGEDYSESGTPRRRRGRPLGSGAARGRGGGFRGRRKGQLVETPRVVIDKVGTTLDVVDDEALVDQDASGDTKVDANGNLKGGREYRVRTFTIMSRGERLYMLSTEPARCCGFRDSYLFFTKHPKLYKVLISEEEKMDLIAREILPNSYKGRNIGVVTARSVFREFGARIVVGGRRVIDDYKENEARLKGVPEGEIADPDDYVPENREDYNRNRYVAWFGASDVYRQAAGGGQVPVKAAIGKRRTNITTGNWQHQHAREAQWEEVSDPEDIQDAGRRVTNGTLENGHSISDTSNNLTRPESRDTSSTTIFSKVSGVISRKYTVVDVVYSAPPISNIGYPGPDGPICDYTSGSNGLSSIPAELVDELPEECRRAFESARAAEVSWKKQWGTERQTSVRGDLKIGFLGYPV